MSQAACDKYNLGITRLRRAFDLLQAIKLTKEPVDARKMKQKMQLKGFVNLSDELAALVASGFILDARSDSPSKGGRWFLDKKMVTEKGWAIQTFEDYQRHMIQPFRRRPYREPKNPESLEQLNLPNPNSNPDWAERLILGNMLADFLHNVTTILKDIRQEVLNLKKMWE